MGRPPLTTRGRLEEIAFTLFADEGYDATSVDDIARAAGISRRTFFRYFSSKTDLVWGDFDTQLAGLRQILAGLPTSDPLLETIRRAVVADVVALAAEGYHRQRISLILGVPTLLANSTLRFAQWRAVLAEYAAARLGALPDDLAPAVLGYSALGATLAAYERWLDTDEVPLAVLVDAALRGLASGFEP